MKDFLTSIDTPSSLPNDPMTMNITRRRSTSYLAESHWDSAHAGRPTSNDDPTKVLHIEKLEKVAVISPVVSPFDLLPNEVISIILEHGYFESRTGSPNLSFRSLATKISRRFRDITLQTPSLWAVINFSPGNIFDEIDLLPSYLERSKCHPLEIDLCCFWASDLTNQLMTQLVPHSWRWQQLSIAAVNDYILNTLQHVSAPFLNKLAITFYSNRIRAALPSPIFRNDLSRLEHLSLRNLNIDTIDFSLRKLKALDIRGYGIWPSFTRLNEMIGHSSLQYLKLQVKPSEVLSQVWTLDSNHVTRPSGQILLPELVCLVVYTSEWLTEDVANLCRLFACPKLQIFALQEDLSASAETSHTIVRYLSSYERSVPPIANEFPVDCREVHTHILSVKSASVYHAYSSLTYSGVSMLTTLELVKITFPPLSQMRQMFAGLPKLEHVFILDLVSIESLVSIMDTVRLDEVNWNDLVGTIDVPTLRTFMIAFPTPISSCTDPRDDGLKEFLRLFNLPSLSDLVMKNLTLSRWQTVVDVFTQGGVERYPELKALKLINMKNALSINIQDAEFINPIPAFPRLEELYLKGVHTNAFLAYLLHGDKYPTDGLTSETAWPRLKMLAISNDPLTSRPLLHHVIAARKVISRPLKKLLLDSRFAYNAESLMWMKEQVDVVEIMPCQDN